MVERGCEQYAEAARRVKGIGIQQPLPVTRLLNFMTPESWSGLKTGRIISTRFLIIGNQDTPQARNPFFGANEPGALHEC